MSSGFGPIPTRPHVTPTPPTVAAGIEKYAWTRRLCSAPAHAREFTGHQRICRAFHHGDEQGCKRVSCGEKGARERPIARVVLNAARASGSAEHPVNLEDRRFSKPLRGIQSPFGQRPEGTPNPSRFVERRGGTRRLFHRSTLQCGMARRVNQAQLFKPCQITVEGEQGIWLAMPDGFVGVDEVQPESAGGKGNSRTGHRAPNLHSVPLTDIHRIAVGSTNPVKVAAVRAVFARLAPDVSVHGIAVASGVPDQPIGDDQTIAGATTRARAARAALNADVGVGIEGGVVTTPQGMRTCAWAVIVGADDMPHVGGSLSMPLPDAVAALIHRGAELGHAIDQLIGTTNIKHGAGAVGVLTEGLVNRQEAYETILAYALAPLLHTNLYHST